MRFACGRAHLLIGRGEIAVFDVGLDGVIEEHDFLRNDGDLLAKLLEIKLTYRMTIYSHFRIIV